MKIKFKKTHPNFIEPSIGSKDSAGIDLYCVDRNFKNEYVEYNLGMSIEIPKGYGGFLFPRSSVSNYSLSLANSVGVIDPDYRGPLKVRFNYEELKPLKYYEIGERVCQLIVIKTEIIQLELSDELSETDRGDGGFGSTGIN